MKIGAILMFLITMYELISLLLGKKILAGKVYIEPNSISILLITIVAIILFYLSIKLKW